MLLLIWSGLSGRVTEKEPLPIGEYEIPSHPSVSTIFGLIRFDVEHRTNRDRLFRHSQSDQRIRAAAFNHPLDGLAVGSFHIDVKPRMGIDHFPFLQGSLQFQRLGYVKFR